MQYLWEERKRTLFGLPWSFTKYKLTDDRLFVITGLFTLNEDEVRLYRIMDLQLVRTFGQRLFGLGSIYVHSSDKSLGDFEIKNIKDSERIKEILSEKVEQERERKRVASREFISSAVDSDDM